MQADLLTHLATRVVVPLFVESKSPQPIADLNPVFDIGGQRFVLIPQAIATVPRRDLKPAIASLTDGHDRITRALDLLVVRSRRSLPERRVNRPTKSKASG